VTGDASAPTGDGAVHLSACIIARDEELALPDCLASVAFCDEIVVVDGGSTDRTVAIAEAAGARVVRQPWLGYGAQRNVALDHARGAWVLEVDCDERVSPPLRAEIAAFVRTAPGAVDLAGLPRRAHLVGRRLGPSAKYPQYVHRLVRRGAQRHDEERTVHEGLVPDGPTHPFTHDLEHLFALTWREAVGDAWRYAKLEADQIPAPRTARAFLLGALARPAAKVVYRLVVDGGWRDGPHGLAQIALDAGTDSAVWCLHLARGDRTLTGDSGRSAGQHYGAWTFRRGDARIVAVAYGARAAAHATRWLAQARAAGADVALVTDAPAVPAPAPDASGPVRRRSVRRAGPLLLARALDAEEQLRSYDALVTFGRPARLLARVLPGRLRGLLVASGEDAAPAAVRDQALAARREEHIA
jgi:hypothetical protein